MELVTDKVRY